MRSIGAGLTTHIQQENTSLATCWRVVLTNGTIKGFTDHDIDIVYNGLTYLASTGFTPSAVRTSATLAVGNLDISGFLVSPTITEQDLDAGLWDYASIEVFMLNWADPTQGIMKQQKGHLGEVTRSENHFVAELRGIMQAYSQNIGELYTPSCRASVFDARCKVNPATYTQAATVTTINPDNRQLTAAALTQAAGYFTSGLITFTSGLNIGLSMECKEYTVGTLALHLPMPYVISIGDTFSAQAGCDKSFATCKAKYNNHLNFRGEPHVPGSDALQQVGTRT